MIEATIDSYLEDLPTTRLMVCCLREDSPVGRAVRSYQDRATDLLLEDLLVTARASGLKKPHLKELRFCARMAIECTWTTLALLIDDPTRHRAEVVEELAHWGFNAISGRIHRLLAEERAQQD